MRVRIRSSASLNAPPGKVVEAIVFKLGIMNYELGRTKTANIEDPTFNGALGASAITENANLESGNQMKTLRDCFGRSVRLTDERLAHTLERPEMKEMGGEIERLLQQPQLVKRSRSDEAVRLFYQFYTHTLVG